MKNLIEYILILLVEHPEDVKVIESEDDRGAVYTIHVNKEDIGRVIGKGGSVIQSIRNIGKIRAVKEGIHAYINLAEDDDEASDEE